MEESLDHTPQTRQILVVDDNEDMADLCKEVLVNSGYEVQTAGSGKDAFKILGTDHLHPNLVLLDFQLGDMSGTTWLERFESEYAEDFDNALVIFISAGEVPASKAYGAMTKPFKIKDLLATVDRAIGHLT